MAAFRQTVGTAGACLAGELCRLSGLSTAIGRLGTHAETWQLVERRVAGLRRQPEGQLAAAFPRLAASGPSATVVSPEVAALVWRWRR